MRDGYVVVRTFINELEADVARNKLEAMGLEAEVQSDNCGGLRPHMDLTLGVRLLVPATDLPYARELLTETGGQDMSPAWHCSGCRENIDPGFDVCWNCGQERP